jgi:CRISPR-associated protein Cmr4
MANKMETRVLGLYAETSLHAGSGHNVGVIDLPIQREAHTGWPCVYGSALKGPLRTLASEENWVDEVFGPEQKQVGDNPNDFHAGALSVGDARLLLLPVRSLTSHFKWVTCPAILERMKADYRRLGKTINFNIPEISKHKALISNKTEQQDNNKTEQQDKLFLEELRFNLQEEESLNQVISDIIPLMGDPTMVSNLRKQLVIVHNDIFNHLSQYATPVAPHISIDSETKTTKGGALWYEESLPPDTLLYSALVMQKSRKGNQTSTDLIAEFSRLLTNKNYLQIGGNETTGMGWCKMSLIDGVDNESVQPT